MIMKKLKPMICAVLTAVFAAAPLAGIAAETKKNAKPYPLKTCIVSDEKLGGMGDPYVFVHEGQEIKLCCKGCVKDFKKAPQKYLKKLDAKDKSK